ncbi:hypothetical protein [Salinibius halmophilus]|uniref:hypothetical protein n=1 Tax=Salinibius halmophilus TaxID=1853216 RepID=UPI000E66E08D|nr:hypothetical protein [Salinibius halmophilus]
MFRVSRAFIVLALASLTCIAAAQTPGPEYLDKAKTLVSKDPRQAIALIDAVLALPDLPESVQLNAQLLRVTAESHLAKQQSMTARITIYQGLFHTFEQTEQEIPNTGQSHSYLNAAATLPLGRCFNGGLRLSASAELHLENELWRTSQADSSLIAAEDEHDSNTKLPSPGWSLGTVCKQSDWEVEARFASALQVSESSSFNRGNSISLYGRTQLLQVSAHYTLNSDSNAESTGTDSGAELAATPITVNGQVRAFRVNNQQLSLGLNAQLQGDELSDYINFVYGQASGRINRFTWSGGLRWPVPFDGSTDLDDGSKRNWWANASAGWQLQPQLIVQAGWQYNYSIEQQYWISLTWQTR